MNLLIIITWYGDSNSSSHFLSSVSMPAFVTAATASIPNFKGLKFTSNDLSEGAQVLRALNSDQEMFLGGDSVSFYELALYTVVMTVKLNGGQDLDVKV